MSCSLKTFYLPSATAQLTEIEMYRLALTALIATVLSCATADAQRRQVVSTRFGDVQVIASGDRRCLFARDQILYCSTKDHLIVESQPIINLRDYVVVLVDENCAGSGCAFTEETSFLVLTASSARHQKSSFRAAWSAASAEIQGPNSFRITLPYELGAISTMTFNSGRFDFASRPASGLCEGGNVRSSVIDKISWCILSARDTSDNARGTLTIMFSSGAVYEYYGVERYIFYNLFGAESIGRFFNRHIRGNYLCARVGGAPRVRAPTSCS